MVDKRITDLSALGTGLAWGDVVEVVDVSDTTDDASGSSRKMSTQDRLSGQRLLNTNFKTASQTGFSADTYISNSNLTLPSGFTAGTTYRLLFDVTKTALGTGTPTVTVRVGTTGTTTDGARCTLAFSAGSAAIDNGYIEVHAVFRSVGATTTAVLIGSAVITNSLASTGLVGVDKAVAGVVSSGFDSTTAGLIIGCSYNGGTSAAHTIQMARAELLV